MTTRERTDSASPLEKFETLADDIDRLRAKVIELEGQRSVDELLEIVHLDSLAEQLGVPVSGLRRKLSDAGGKIFKIGKLPVIRKIKLLAAFERIERS